MKSKLLIVFTLLLFTITGCDYFENGDTLDISTIEANISELPVLPDSMTYVGWFNSDDYGAVKVFAMDADQNGSIKYVSNEKFENLLRAQEFFITTEKKSVISDSNLVPSERILLFGRFSDAACNLTISETSPDFENLNEVFNLATPTNGPETDELSGVWFVDSISTNLQAGLNLPDLYAGWIYEGWVQIDGQYISTGRFVNPKAADLYSAFGGALAGYNFPGEDFLIDSTQTFSFPINLSNANVIVSIEYNDGRTHGTEPFLKIFEATVPASAQSDVSYPLQFTNAVLTGGNAFMVVDLVK